MTTWQFLLGMLACALVFLALWFFLLGPGEVLTIS